MKKRWLGIDPGLAIIGWAILEDHEPKEPLLIDYGTIETHKGIPTPARLLEIADDMTAIAQDFDPIKLPLKCPILVGKSKRQEE